MGSTLCSDLDLLWPIRSGSEVHVPWSQNNGLLGDAIGIVMESCVGGLDARKSFLEANHEHYHSRSWSNLSTGGPSLRMGGQESCACGASEVHVQTSGLLPGWIRRVCLRGPRQGIKAREPQDNREPLTSES